MQKLVVYLVKIPYELKYEYPFIEWEELGDEYVFNCYNSETDGEMVRNITVKKDEVMIVDLQYE
ncbi:MAG: hypothetical protein WC877_00075 [Dehalococcoidales bacterium]|jgi:hypothetical protein